MIHAIVFASTKRNTMTPLFFLFAFHRSPLICTFCSSCLCSLFLCNPPSTLISTHLVFRTAYFQRPGTLTKHSQTHHLASQTPSRHPLLAPGIMAPQAAILPVIPIDAPSSRTTTNPDLITTLTSQSAISSPTDTNDKFGGGGENGSFNTADSFQTSGGYIYVILIVTFLVAIIYFGRVCLAKRREKKRLLKEDCEVPPGYLSHLYDMQVFVSNHAGVESSHPGPSGEGASTVTLDQPSVPPAALTRTPPPSLCPPAYETVVGQQDPSYSALSAHDHEHIATVTDSPAAASAAATALQQTPTAPQSDPRSYSV
ncbi:hypothetical protein KVV02_008034 [Mortierella alpina]|uniref:Uncharacterized protein n=1 Tax=Mortierella alpina TaxID=64518 RepID=A0A9P8ABY8_MORAP|nr:hypothetical protein KVV02_008034 [Mortierella alpina]